MWNYGQIFIEKIWLKSYNENKFLFKRIKKYNKYPITRSPVYSNSSAWHFIYLLLWSLWTCDNCTNSKKGWFCVTEFGQLKAAISVV